MALLDCGNFPFWSCMCLPTVCSCPLTPMSSLEPQPPSSPELAPTAFPTPPELPKKNIRRTARMSTGGKRPTPKSSLILRSNTSPTRQQLLDFPTRQRLAKEGSAYVLPPLFTSPVLTFFT